MQSVGIIICWLTAMQYAVNNPQVVKLNNKELKEELRRIRRKGFREKAGRFIENYIEIVIGVCISVSDHNGEEYKGA